MSSGTGLPSKGWMTAQPQALPSPTPLLQWPQKLDNMPEMPQTQLASWRHPCARQNSGLCIHLIAEMAWTKDACPCATCVCRGFGTPAAGSESLSRLARPRLLRRHPSQLPKAPVTRGRAIICPPSCEMPFEHHGHLGRRRPVQALLRVADLCHSSLLPPAFLSLPSLYISHLALESARSP